MRQAIGVALFPAGLTPVVGLLALWVCSRHMYTVGLSMNVRGVTVLALLTLFDLCCLGVGLHLLRKPQFSD